MNVPVYSVVDGQTVVTYPDGTVMPVMGGNYAPVEQGAGAPVAPEPGPGFDSAPVDGESQGGGYPEPSAGELPPPPPGWFGSSTASGGGYAPNSGYAPTADESGTDPFAASGNLVGSQSVLQQSPTPLPLFGDGSLTPLASGRRRTPGGFWNVTPYESSPGRQVSVPGGAAAGPYETRAAYPPHASGGGYAHDAGGGGGSAAKGRFWSLYNKFRYAGPGGSSGGYGSSSRYPASAGGTVAQPQDTRVHTKFGNFDASQVGALAYYPMALASKATSIPAATPAYENLANMPLYQLALLSGHYNGSPKSLVNAVGSTVHKVGEQDWLPSIDKLVGNMVHQGKGLDQMFNGIENDKATQRATGYQYEYGHEPLPTGTAATQAQQLIDAALQVGLPQETAAKYSAYSNYLMAQAVKRDMHQPPGAGKNVLQMVGRKLKGAL